MHASSLLAPLSHLSLNLVLLAHLLHALPSVIAEQSTQSSPISQPILSPNHTSLLATGSLYLITWEPSRNFSNITLEIWDNTLWGYSRDFGSFPCYHWSNPFCGTIISHAPNNGSYLWNVPQPVRVIGHRYPIGEQYFWIKLYVDDFWKEGMNTEPVVTYSERFAFAAVAGEDGAESSTTGLEAMVAPTMAPNVIQQSTALVTGQNPTSTYSGATTRSFNASVLPTGVPKKNNTDAVSINGMASKVGRSLPGSRMMFLGWLVCWGWREVVRGI
jgi:hypothetical protein